MANFLEQQPRRYNDYVGMPTDTYAAVGLYKQGMYEQGIQQIQTALSTVAGLEVSRDVDKKYLESKVNEVTSKVNNIAGGDWSNKNLVSKATGIASTVAKDQYVQDAVYSSASLKQLEESQKTLKEKNPELYPVSAEWYDTQEAQRYLSSNELGDKYRGPKEATRHFGVKRDEEIRKALKELHPSVVQTVTPAGEYTYTYDKTTTVTPAQIQNVVNGVIGSNSEFQKSLQIDASFSYKDASVEDLIKSIPEKQLEIQKRNIEADANIDNIIKLNPGLSVDEVKKLQDQKEENKKYADRLVYDYQVLRGGVESGDPAQIERAKQMNFTDRILGGYIENFKQFSQEKEIKENVETKARLDWIKAGLDPDTQLPPTPGSKYDAYAKSLKKGKDGSSTGDLLSTVPATGEANKMQDVPTLQTYIDSLEESNTSLYNNFISDLKLKNNFTQEEAAAYMEIQAEKFRTGNPVDKDYLQYQKSQEENTAVITANKEVIMEANKKAEAEAPTNNLGIKSFDGLSFSVDYGPSGKIVHNLNEFNKLVESFIDRAGTGEALKKIPETDPDYEAYKKLYIAGGSREIQKNFAAKYLIDKQEGRINNQSFNDLKEIIGKGYTKYSDKVLDPIRAQFAKQEDIKNKYIESRMNTVTGTSMVIDKDSDAQKNINNLIINSYEAEDSKKEGASIPDNISATGIYRDPASGDVYATFSSGKTGSQVVQTKKIPSGSVVGYLPPISSYEKIKSAIEISPYKKSTPLTTSNGKLTYKVGKMGGSYYVQIQINGLWRNVDYIESPYIDDVIKKLEVAASNPALKDVPPNQYAALALNFLNPQKEQTQ